MARVEQQGLSLDRDSPLVVGPIHGLRTWSLEFDHGRARLSASYAEASWERDGAPTTAVCLGGSWPRPHKPPGKWCDCGLYALHPDLESATSLLRDSGADSWPTELCGLIEAWGRVEVHESGFRAEFARPVALILARDQVGTDWGNLIEGLARAHRAEVLELDTPEELAGHCRSRDLGLSRGAVAELLPAAEDELPESPAVPPSPAGPASNAGGPTRKRTVGDLGAALAAGIAGLIGVAFWLAVWGGIGYAVLGLIFGWFEIESHSPTAAASRHLRVVDQAVLGAGGPSPVFVAVLENDDPRRTALGVTPRLRLASGGRIGRLASSGAFEQPANVPAGGTAVAVDRLRAVPAGRLGDPQFEVAAFRRAPEFPVQRMGARLDENACVLTAEITAFRRLASLKLIGLAKHAGRIVGGSPFHLGPIPRGRSEHRLPALAGPLCHLRAARWSLYPALAPWHGRWR